VECGAALDGCRINDGNTNPIVLTWDEAGHNYNYVSKQVADAIWGQDSKCACVGGNVALSKTKPTFVYFTKAWAVTSRAEAKCSEEGL
jgi:hypothetical protein